MDDAAGEKQVGWGSHSDRRRRGVGRVRNLDGEGHDDRSAGNTWVSVGIRVETVLFGVSTDV